MSISSNKSQNGFSVVEIVLAITAISIVGFVGWFVYDHNRAKPTTAAPNNSQTNTEQTPDTTEPTATDQNVVKISELGIQITVPDSIKDLTYKVSTATLVDGSQATQAMFSTQALIAADANCGTESAPLGSLQHVNGQYPDFSSGKYAPIDFGQLVKQYPDYYIASGHPNAACSTTQSAGSAEKAKTNNALANDGKQTFSSSYSSIQPLE